MLDPLFPIAAKPPANTSTASTASTARIAVLGLLLSASSLAAPPADRELRAAKKDFANHWSYLSPGRPELPDVSDESWVQNDIDRFVMARMDAAGISPAPRADARTLARRLSLDLVGMPPPMDQIARLIPGADPTRVSRFVEELLHSPHHAERLATFWLDLVRYADTTGIHADNRWNTWLYRDWVVAAFRDNKPFDEFTREQLAGDLLADATVTQRVGAAYNRLNLVTREGGSQPKEFLIRYSADRARNAGEVWLAASVGCAECHDHKFDPISTREFYEFSAFFADIEQVGVYADTNRRNYFAPEMKVPSEDQLERREAVDQRIRELDAELSTMTPAMAADFDRFRDEGLRSEAQWTGLTPTTLVSEGGASFVVGADDVIAVGGESPSTDTYRIAVDLKTSISAVRIELLEHESLPSGGPGRATNGNLVLSELEIYADGLPIEVSSAEATHSQDKYAVGLAADGSRGKAGWAIRGPDGTKRADAVFRFSRAAPEGSHLELVLHQDYGGAHTLGRFRISGRVSGRISGRSAAELGSDTVRSAPDLSAPDLSAPDLLSPDIREAFAPARWSDSDDEKAISKSRSQRIRDAFLNRTPLLAGPRAEKAEWIAERERLEESVPVVLETRSVDPMEVRVRPRGDWTDDSGDVVLPGVPAAFGGLESDGRATRLDLAEWLTRPDHPLVARVLMNRVWRMFFGRGLVSSLDDFGLQGAEPTHPALLDYLAVEFVESGYDIRHMIRLIVNSAAYAQSSASSEEQRAMDPENRWLARQSRFRIDAEFVRDTVLQASGLLVRDVGGPAVFPYQPEGYWDHLNFPTRSYEPSKGDDLYRRTIYSHWQRQYLHPSLLAFDAPGRERCRAARDRSSTPQAALALLNDPIFVEAARVLAARMASRDEPSLVRLDWAYQRVLQRLPQPEESQVLLRLLEEHREYYRAHPNEAAELSSVGDYPVSGDTVEIAAWTSIARVLLNLHETITRS